MKKYIKEGVVINGGTPIHTSEGFKPFPSEGDYLANGYSIYEEPKEVYTPTQEELNQQKIFELKEQLSTTDYKVIKCMEASLIGESMPYDVVELHAERQAIRNQINELEG